ncbi:MAG: 2-amino-4-hydroxy-6-hydroxymethyldihydropteridine diphosphokinase [Solirubrobacteraceae bacterium]
MARSAVSPGASGEMVAERRGLIGLGSNVGDRRSHLQAALAALSAAGISVDRSSSVYDTDPVGEVPDQGAFLNACLGVRTALEPLALLDVAKRLERELGRQEGGPRHGPRPIDIDILMLGEVELAHERMRLPHEELLHRRFVLIPALELEFAMCTPAGERLSDALAALPFDEGVRFAGPPLDLEADRASAPSRR